MGLFAQCLVEVDLAPLCIKLADFMSCGCDCSLCHSGAERHDSDGHTKSDHGWRRVYTAGKLHCMTIEFKVLFSILLCVVMSLPHERVLQSAVEECASQWYRLGTELGYKDNQIRAMTCDIPTLDGKLQAIIGRKSMELEKRVVEALLDACDKIMPLATVAVLKDLGIKYIGTGKAVLFVCILNGSVDRICSF